MSYQFIAMISRTYKLYLLTFILPLIAVFSAFFLLPLARLAITSAYDSDGVFVYGQMLTNPRYLSTLIATFLLAVGVTAATLIIASVTGVFLQRNDFPGKRLLVALLTFPLAFPGVVVGFLIILLAGRQGLLNTMSKAVHGPRLVLAYSMTGLFLGYIYFSIPRVITTIMATAAKIDPQLEEAARSLGAAPWAVLRDVLIPALLPGLVSAGALCFATAMGAFGTAFTLATNIDVLPMVIYTEFTLSANMSMAAALSIVLGLITWGALAVARAATGETFAASA